MGLLMDLAERADLAAWIRRMFSGERINNTEGRAVLHVALRSCSDEPVLLDGEDVMPQVRAVLAQNEKIFPTRYAMVIGWVTQVSNHRCG